MPLFTQRKPAQTVSRSIAAALSSSAEPSPLEALQVDNLSSQTAFRRAEAEHQGVLTQKLMAEAQAARDAATARNDPQARLEHIANSAGTTADAVDRMSLYTRYAQPGDAPPLGISEQIQRAVQAASAALSGTQFATGKTNADEMAKAQGTILSNIVRNASVGLPAEQQNANVGAFRAAAREPFSTMGNEGVVTNQETGQTIVAQPTLLNAAVSGKDESKKLRDIMLAGGIDPESPQGQAIFRAAVQKAATHAPAASNNVTIKQETEEAKTVGKGLGEAFNKTQEGAIEAGNKINRYKRLDSLLADVNTGKLTPAGTELAAWAQAAGLNIDKNLGNKQAAKALSNEIALTLRNPSGGAGMPGALSDRDREFLVSMTPSLANTPEGNRQLIGTAVSLAKREQDVARLARNYRQKNGTLGPGFFEELQQFSDKNPLFTSTPAAPAAAPADRRAAPRAAGSKRIVVDY